MQLGPGLAALEPGYEPWCDHNREEIKKLSLRVPDSYIEQGRIFYTSYERVEAIFILKRARVRIYRVAPEREEFTLDIVGPGTVFGQMSLTAQRLENAYAGAMEPLVVCIMKREDLK